MATSIVFCSSTTFTVSEYRNLFHKFMKLEFNFQTVAEEQNSHANTVHQNGDQNVFTFN